jgi:hypothetical protein
MTDIDFIELANYCQNSFKEKHNTRDDYYVKTLFVAITNEGDVIVSTTPHILRKAEQCILIHERSTLAYKYHYLWYHVEFINKDGVVYDQRLDGKFTLSIVPFNGLDNQVMSLKYDNNTIYSCKEPWEINIIKVWNLYSRVKDLKSLEEIKLIVNLFQKDDKILELEKEIEDFKFTKHLLEQERNQYKSLLDEIKQIVENK